MKILVIPTTDWTGHPVPNRLNFVFDRLASTHHVDVCHFRLFNKAVRDTNCNLIEMDDRSIPDVRTYYIKRFLQHSKKISDISNNYDLILSSNILPGLTASIQDTRVIVDYMDLYSESAASYFSSPLDHIVKNVVSLICDLNMESASGIITPTDRFKEYLNKRVTAPVEVIPNGVDTKVMRPVRSDIQERYDLGYPVLGYVGSLESWIALDDIFSMFPDVLKKYPEASLLIVGGALHTGYDRYLKEKADEYNITDRVTFTGNLPYKDLAPYISAMDVGLNPRKPWNMNTFTMGSKVLNCLACGVPVLSTNMPVAEELFGEEKGVYRYHGKDEFLEKLGLAMENKVDAAAVKDYDWDVIADKYGEVITRFLRSSTDG